MSAGEPPIRHCKNSVCCCDGSCLRPELYGKTVYIDNKRFFYMGDQRVKEFEYSDIEDINNWNPKQ